MQTFSIMTSKEQTSEDISGVSVPSLSKKKKHRVIYFVSITVQSVVSLAIALYCSLLRKVRADK